MKKLSNNEKCLAFGGFAAASSTGPGLPYLLLLGLHAFVSFATAAVDLTNLYLDTTKNPKQKNNFALSPTLKNDNFESKNIIIS